MLSTTGYRNITIEPWVNPPEVFELSRWKAFLHEQDLDTQGSYVVINRTHGHCAAHKRTNEICC